MKKPLLCRLGWHTTYVWDPYGVECCNWCDWRSREITQTEITFWNSDGVIEAMRQRYSPDA